MAQAHGKTERNAVNPLWGVVDALIRGFDEAGNVIRNIRARG